MKQNLLASTVLFAAMAVASAQDAFTLAPLPYAGNAMEPFISAKTMGFHYGKHHKGYDDNLNKLVAGMPMAAVSLEALVAATAGKEDKTAVFNNAAQVWNHDFFWQSMKPAGGGKPSGKLAEMIDKSFGDYDAFAKQFIATGLAQFGSGWVWLVQDGETLKIVKTANADTPAAHGQRALLACDVWEHAYYLDYQNRRKDFVQVFLDHLVNWDFAASRLR